MTIEEIEKRQDELAAMWDELQAEINALKKAQAEEAKPKPPHPSWLPQEHENYYTIMSDGTPDTRLWHDSIDGGTSIRRYSLGNVFKAKEAAEFAVERLKVLAEMREWAGNWDDTFVLTYIGNDDILQISSVLMSRNTFGEMRFATKEDAENCIKAVGKERIKKYYFMIPEGE